jgi:hypothetical protein
VANFARNKILAFSIGSNGSLTSTPGLRGRPKPAASKLGPSRKRDGCVDPPMARSIQRIVAAANTTYRFNFAQRTKSWKGKLMLNQRKAAVPFVVITVFLDILGIGIVIPVLPALVGSMTTNPDQQAY